MPTKTVEIRDARLEELLSLVAEGSEVVLTEDAAPVARLVPISRKRSRMAGLHPGAMNASEDFDEVLPEAFWTGIP